MIKSFKAASVCFNPSAYVSISVSCSPFAFKTSIVVSPNLLSIEFVDDRTIEYEFSLVIGENASTGYYRVKYFSIIPDDEYKIVENTYEMTNGKIVFNKDIPDGVTVKLEFYDFDRNYILTHRFVKGEESESL